MDFLPSDYRSTLGLPVVNIPGCSPVGDNFTDTVAAVLLFLQGIGPLPEFDELGRPAWLFNETVHRGCNRAGFYEEGDFAEEYGDKECLVEIGCWGPVVQCNINKRGAINNMGGCMNTGSPCIGCTMPGFPDAFSPFYKRPPGTLVSSSASKVHGAIIRALRNHTRFFNNRTRRWDEQGHVPNGWGNVREPNLIEKAVHFIYKKVQKMGSSSKI
jgi:hydrogenase small subunit